MIEHEVYQGHALIWRQDRYMIERAGVVVSTQPTLLAAHAWVEQQAKWLGKSRKPKPAPMPARPSSTTTIEYGTLDEAFAYLNKTLFDGKLPDALIVYARKPRMLGHFAHDRYTGRVDAKLKKPEIALNPDAFVNSPDEEIVSTLLHEMVHHWQQHFSKPPSRGYHNREWAAKMQQVGLMPSNTGQPGGKETGMQMDHYILDGGPYRAAFKQLAATGWKLNLQSMPRSGPNSKNTFSCQVCGDMNAWGKNSLAILCEPCTAERVRAVMREHGTGDAAIEQTIAAFARMRLEIK